MLPRQNRYRYSAINERPDYSWPEGKRLAFWVGTNVEVFAFLAGLGPDPVDHYAPQTYRNYAWREYGLRVGIWSLFNLYDELGLPGSFFVNSLIYDDHRAIVDRIRARGDDVIGHGRTNSERQIEFWEEDERRLIIDAATTIEKHGGAKPKGWLGPHVSESNVTLDLLKEAGFTYVLDWPCDDQPIWLNTRSGKILSVPYPIELNDFGQIIHRQQSAHQFCDMIVDQFDEMVRRCVDHPLVCSISLHAFIVGQPFRVPPLRRALKHILEHKHRDRVWFTRANAIADHCYSLAPGIIPGS